SRRRHTRLQGDWSSDVCSSDLLYARFIAQRLQESMGQTFVVDDRPGAGSIIGTDAVAKSPADGYTLLLMSNTHTVNESLIPTKRSEERRVGKECESAWGTPYSR